MKKLSDLLTWVSIAFCFISAACWLTAALDSKATDALDLIAPGYGNIHLDPTYLQQLSAALKSQAVLNKYAAYAAAAAALCQGLALLFKKFAKTPDSQA